jgi:hypothetical protein
MTYAPSFIKIRSAVLKLTEGYIDGEPQGDHGYGYFVSLIRKAGYKHRSLVNSRTQASATKHCLSSGHSNKELFLCGPRNVDDSNNKMNFYLLLHQH